MKNAAGMLMSLVAFAATPHLAAAAGMITSIEGMTSTIMQQGQSSFSGLGLRMRLHPEQLVESVTLMPAVEYWRNTNNVESFGIESTRKDATLAMDIRYDFTHSGWRPYIGAGLALHFISEEVVAPRLGLDENNSLMKGGLAVLGGVAFGITDKLHNLIELKYHHVTEHEQLKINWGLSYSP